MNRLRKVPLNNTSLEIPTQLSNPDRARLRVLVAAIDGELSRRPSATATGGSGLAPDELIASWAEVVRLLALGRAPELRECFDCGNVGMRAARLCGYCWAKLPPLVAG